MTGLGFGSSVHPTVVSIGTQAKGRGCSGKLEGSGEREGMEEMLEVRLLNLASRGEN